MNSRRALLLLFKVDSCAVLRNNWHRRRMQVHGHRDLLAGNINCPFGGFVVYPRGFDGSWRTLQGSWVLDKPEGHHLVQSESIRGGGYETHKLAVSIKQVILRI